MFQNGLGQNTSVGVLDKFGPISIWLRQLSLATWLLPVQYMADIRNVVFECMHALGIRTLSVGDKQLYRKCLNGRPAHCSQLGIDAAAAWPTLPLKGCLQ